MQHSANHKSMATWHPINSPVRIQLEEGRWFRTAVRTTVPLLVKLSFRGYTFELEREAIAKAMCLPGSVCQGGRGWGKQIRNVAAGPHPSDSDRLDQSWWCSIRSPFLVQKGVNYTSPSL